MMQWAAVSCVVVAGVGISLSSQSALAGSAKACAKDLASCSINGCAKPGSAATLMNKIKRTVPAAGTPTPLSLDDFEMLQEHADNLVGQHKDLTAAMRKKLKGLAISGGEVSEGDLVEVRGYVIAQNGLPHPNTGESVNCNLKRAINNDFHIPIARSPNDSIYDGIVVEMIPQDRPSSWTISKLKKAASEKRQVLVRGQLLYDSKHFVNDNPAEPIGGQPARFSLWEVHPVTEFMVCKKQDQPCDPADWEPLEEFGQQ